MTVSFKANIQQSTKFFFAVNRGFEGCFFYYVVIRGAEINISQHKSIIFAAVMEGEKVQIAYRIDLAFYERLAKNADRKGMTVPQYTRYILKKYFQEHDAKKTNTNP